MASFTPTSGQRDPFLAKDSFVTVSGQYSPYSNLDTGPVHHDPVWKKFENTKKVLSRQVRLPRGLEWLKPPIHFLALAATIIVLQLSFRYVYWFDSGRWSTKWYLFNWDQDEVMNALQFAAKLYEILVVGSLSAMVMHVVRRRLIGRGIPFGLLTSGYQAGSIEFLFSKSFRASAWRSLGEFFFVLFIGLVIVFANMVGPSSAIAILPTLDWWPVQDPFNGQPLTSYLFANLSDVYPQHVVRPSGDERAECFSMNYTEHTLCPNRGYDTLIDWAVAYANENAGANVSMLEPLSGTRRQLVSQNVSISLEDPSGGVGGGDAGVAIATTLHQSVVSLVGLFWNYVKPHNMGLINDMARPLLAASDDSPVASPLVQVECNYFDYFDALNGSGAAAQGVTFPTMQLNNFSVNFYPADTNWLVDQNLFNFSRPRNITNFTWVNLVDYNKSASPPQGASLGALVTVPYLIDYINGNVSNNAQSSWLLPCTVDARWAGATVNYDPNNSDMMETNLTNPANFTLMDAANALEHDFEYQQSLWGISNALQIDTEWASMLDLPGVETSSNGGEYFNTSMMQSLFLQFVNNHTFNGISTDMANGTQYRTFDSPYMGNTTLTFGAATAVTVQTILSMVLAEALSRVAYDSAFPITMLDNNPSNTSIVITEIQYGGLGVAGQVYYPYNRTLLSQLPAFDFTVSRYGYGYGWGDSPTMHFGLTVLTLYAVIVGIYMIYSACFWSGKKGWRSTAWGEANELLALALVSPERGQRDILGNVGAGVEEGKTWRKCVRIEGGDDDRLELVVAEQLLGREGGTERERQVRIAKKYR